MSKKDQDIQPERVLEPQKPTMIDTGESGEAKGFTKIELENLLQEIKLNFEASQTKPEPLVKFVKIIEECIVLAEAHDSNADMNNVDATLYDQLIAGTANKLVTYSKTDNAAISEAVHKSIDSLIDLLIVELRNQTATSLSLVKAIRPLFDPSKVFYQKNDQLNFSLRQAEIPEAIEEVKQQQPAPEPKVKRAPRSNPANDVVNLRTLPEDDIEWRNRLCQGAVIDAVLTDEIYGVAGWVKADIIEIIGDHSRTNLGDLEGNQVKHFGIQYLNQEKMFTKHFRADSTQIAQYDEKTSEDIWRYSIKEDDEVDFLKQSGEWETGVVMKIEEIVGLNNCPKAEIAFRIFKNGQTRLKDKRQMVSLFSLRVQKPQTMGKNSNGPNKQIWQLGDTFAYETSDHEEKEPTLSAEDKKALDLKRQQEQDEEDMAMITEPNYLIYAAIRHSCRSTFFVNMINRLGEAGSFDQILGIITMAGTGLDEVSELVRVVTDSSSIYHKQFVDSYCQRFCDTIEAKLLGVTPAQLGAVKPSKIEEIIRLVWQKLLKRKVFDETQTQQLRGKINLKVGIHFLRHPQIEKRKDGAKLVEGEIKNTDTMNASSLKNQLYEELVDTLKRENILDLFFSKQYRHEVLIKKSFCVLKLLIKQDKLTPEELGAVWDECQGHDSTALEMVSVCKLLIDFSIDSKFHSVFVEKLFNKPNATIRPKEMELMLKMGRKSSSSTEIQDKVIEFFWDYIFNDGASQSDRSASHAYMTENSATNAFDALKELLQLASASTVKGIFARFLQKICSKQHGYFVIAIASRFIQSFVQKGTLHVEALLTATSGEPSLVSLLITELQDYMGFVKTQVDSMMTESQRSGALININKLDEKVFADQFSHKKQLQGRINFIKEVAQKARTQINYEEFSQIWDSTVTQNPIISDHAVVATWMRSFADDLMLGRNQCPASLDGLVEFYRESLCSQGAPSLNISVEGFHCVQSYFLLSNLLYENILVMDQDVKRADLGRSTAHSGALHRTLQHDKIETQSRVAPAAMDGIAVLWQIAIDASDEQVYTRVANLLLKLHSKIETGFESQLKAFEDNFVQTCMEMLKEQKVAFKVRESEGSDVTGEQRRIKACLKLVQMLVLMSEQSGTNGVTAHSSLPHQNTGGSTSLVIPSNVDFLDGILVKNFYHGENEKTKGAYEIGMESWATVLDLKNKMCNELSVEMKLSNGSSIYDTPDHSEIQIRYCRFKRILSDDENSKTLREIGFQPKEKLYVQKKKQITTPLTNTLITDAQKDPDGSPNRPPERTMPDMPRWKISQNKEQFDLLMSLQDIQGEVANEASNVLLMLCTNQQNLQNVLQLKDNANSSFEWSSIFSEDIKVTMYSLDIIETIIKTPLHQNDDDDAIEKVLRLKWVTRFLHQGGFQLFMGQMSRAILLSSSSQQNVVLYRRFVAQVLRLLKTFIFAAICANQDKEVNLDVDSMLAQSTLIKTQSVDQSDIGEGEENGFHAGWTDRLISGNKVVVVAKPSTNKKKQEFEQSQRFKDIVDEIREDNLGSSLIELIDLSELQQQLLEILANYLTNTSSANNEIEGIINGAISLLIFVLNRQNDLVDQVFAWTQSNDQNAIKNFADLVIVGIYNPKSASVREQVKSLVKLIATTMQTNHQASPVIQLIKILMEHLPGHHSDLDSSKSAEFFSLLCALLQQYRQLSEDSSEQSSDLKVELMLQEACTQIKRYESSEQDGEIEDPTLTGLLRLNNELLDWYTSDAAQTPYDQIIAFFQRNELMHEFFYEHLFFMPGKTKSPSQNKCKSTGSRTQAFKLLYKLVESLEPSEMSHFLDEHLWGVVSSPKRPQQWKCMSEGQQQRNKANKHIGLYNYGNICYMISMLQQLYMVPQFRYRLMTAVDQEAESIQEYKDRQVDDRLLTQLQRLFGFLELSDKSYADPFNLCFAFKVNGNPTNFGEQRDSQEFVTAFFGKMEELLACTNQKYLLQDTFQFRQVQETSCISCGKTNHRLSSHYMLQLQVKDQADLVASLQMELNGETINDYQCDGCKQKVQIKKRNLLGNMPNVLVVHLQRIEFDMITFQEKKVNSQFDFPSILDLKHFSFKEQSVSIQPESSEDREELERMLESSDDDYLYRLVGVNIHRGQISHGHYWSYINTRRGASEPNMDNGEDDSEWRSSVESDWLEFNDSSVSTANMNQLRSDAIGGSSSNSDIDFESGKSAYMLIYERKRKNKVREVTQSAKDIEKVTQVSGRSVDHVVPSWIQGIVQKDNLDFCFDRQVFDRQFFFLIRLVLKRISLNAITQQQSETSLKLHRTATKIGHRVMFELYPAFGENGIFTDIHEYMKTLLEQKEIADEWLEQQLLKDENSIEHIIKLMLECPTAHVRIHCGNLISKIINRSYKKLESAQDDQATGQKGILDSFLVRIIELLFTKDCQKKWTKLEQFYSMVADIFTGGPLQTELILNRNDASIITDLCDIIMQEKSPKATNDRVKIGDSNYKAPFRPLVLLLSHLVTSMATSTMNEDAFARLNPFSHLSKRYCISEEAIQYMINEFMSQTVTKGDYGDTGFNKALSHVCFGNRAASKKVLRTILQQLNKTNSAFVTKYMHLLCSHLLLEDDYQQQRLEWILGFPAIQFTHTDDHLKIVTEQERFEFRTTLFSQMDANSKDKFTLLTLLWNKKISQESHALRLLELLFDTITESETLMGYFASIPEIFSYHARWTDMIGPFLTQETNRRESSSKVINGISDDAIVQIMVTYLKYKEFIQERGIASPFVISGILSDEQVYQRVGDEDTVSLIISHHQVTQDGPEADNEESKEIIIGAKNAEGDELRFEWKGMGTKKLGAADEYIDPIEFSNQEAPINPEMRFGIIYKLELVNKTGTPILYKIKLEKKPEASDLNLRWPINGIKGSAEEGNSVAALLSMLRPTMNPEGTAELEKLDISLSWRIDEKKLDQKNKDSMPQSQPQPPVPPQPMHPVIPYSPSKLYTAEIRQLREMGIDADEETIRSILESTNGNVDQALGILFG